MNTYGAAHARNLQAAKVLCVGAGGIGCEVLKNLVLMGFLSIEVIDLDTIDISNLNRQFLFRQNHVGKSKAETAAEVAMTFNPDAKITWHYGNVKDAQFGINYVRKFDIVLNALDNVDARRHMNRLCLAAGVPLLDSGTTGFLGQVMPIMKGETACYECEPKPTQKVYPICTIRSTPEKPVHCIVWAKECFKLVFGNPKDSMLFEDEEATGSKSSYMELLTFPTLYEKAVSGDALKKTTEAVVEHATKLLLAIFQEEVQTKIDMKTYKMAKTVPVPVANATFDASKKLVFNVTNNQAVRDYRKSNWEHQVLSDEECGAEMILCILESVGLNIVDGTFNPTALLRGSLSFDKDDILSMRFVAAAACMRSRIFSIETKDFHSAKGIAGNIIPAIATTNAIVAGLQVMAAVKMLKEGTKVTNVKAACPHTYCLRLPTRKGFYLQPTLPVAPVATCFVCGTAQRLVFIDTQTRTLDEFVQLVVKGRLGFNEPAISIGSDLIYEEGEGADEDLANNLKLVLNQTPCGGMVDGILVEVDDDSQDMKVRLIIKHKADEDFDEEKSPGKFSVLDEAEAAAAAIATADEDQPIKKKARIE